MTTPPTGNLDPRDTAPTATTTSTPIGDESAQGLGLNPTTTSDGDATSSSAKDTAKDAASSASDHASDALGTATDEASKVAAEAKDKATDLLADLKSQVGEQSSTQLQSLASKLEELADQIQDLASGSDSSGPVVDVAQQLADRTHALSSQLSSKEPIDLVEDVRGFARRRPGTFLAVAAVAGVAAGRLTRGAKATTDTSTDASSPESSSTSTPRMPTSGTTATSAPATGPSVGSLP